MRNNISEYKIANISINYYYFLKKDIIPNSYMKLTGYYIPW